ncbi:ShlB/FhaC/HecB family hemolysin secretion/activation protein [Grimontia marina]|uniref:Hemolysin transporter protein ShlB n=1 Tax=Grimontia marina TaxID=646534 RepID=A0A128FJ38_9GAMM|nr:ShlB/FhaC/HecB family hemolysin secretion/activation protein [Grimontia marina]CZF86798.1 Hemolysin transporter protein ShlB precursor [Grimontia marina]
MDLKWNFAVFLGLVISPSLSAADLPVSPSTQVEIDKQQEARLKALDEARQSLERLVPLPSEVPSKPVDEANCFEVSQVRVVGNSVLSKKEITQLVSPFAGQCLGAKNINQVLQVLTNAYVAKGYVTTRAVLEPQDLSSGTLTVRVIEGELGGVVINGEDSDAFTMALPSHEGKILNLRDIEQALDQINRLPRYDAKIEMLPGEKLGETVVAFTTRDAGWHQTGLSFDNGGQKSTGDSQLRLNLTGSNLLGVLDLWQVSASTSSEFSSRFDSQSLRAALSVPYGYFTFGQSYTYSDYKTTVDSNNFSFISTGNTSTYASDVNWLFHRDNISKSSLNLALNYTREKNFIDDIKLVLGSRNLANASLALSHATRLGSGFFTVSPRYVRGVKLFNSETDEGKATGSPSAEFNKGELTLQYTLPLTNSLTFSTTGFGQWATDTLYGSQRLSIGGLYSVRGFKEQSLSGDAGYYWRNDLTARLTEVPFWGWISTDIALDTGAIHPDASDPNERGHLTGASVAFSTQNNDFNSSFGVGFPLDHPSWMTVDHYSLYYRFNVVF